MPACWPPRNWVGTSLWVARSAAATRSSRAIPAEHAGTSDSALTPEPGCRTSGSTSRLHLGAGRGQALARDPFDAPLPHHAQRLVEARAGFGEARSEERRVGKE